MEYNTICNGCKQEHEGIIYKCSRCQSWDMYQIEKREGISKQDIQAFKESLKGV